MKFYASASNSTEVEKAIMKALETSENVKFEKNPTAIGDDLFEISVNVEPFES